MSDKVERYSWGEISRGYGGPAFHLSQYGDDDNHTLVIGLIFITFYIRIKKFLNMERLEDQYGFSFCDSGLHLHWGRKFTIWYYPWSWSFYKTWERIETRRIFTTDKSYEWIEVPKFLIESGRLATWYVYNYSYQLENGEIQKRIATYYVSKMVWRWHWLPFLPWPRKTHVSINVNFNDEVGERSGSWKGGTIGCGYEMLKGETPEECIKRMERERKFR